MEQCKRELKGWLFESGVRQEACLIDVDWKRAA